MQWWSTATKYYHPAVFGTQTKVRHKMLDALGDLALAGAPILGHYYGVRAGHSLTNTLLRTMFDTPGAVRMVECDQAMIARLPGTGVVWDEVPAVA